MHETDESPWARPALILLLVGTAGIYLWSLDRSGYANTFYAAAVQAGTKSWKAFFFGSFDAANFVTVDKPPAALWVMELSARVFGFNTWSTLVPQALEGVAAVGVLYATVRRWFGSSSALLAGALLAICPIVAVMFRYNNPDALLVLLLVVAGYAMTRALEAADPRWLAAAAVAMGFAFLTKTLEAFLILPALGLVYLISAPTTLGRRLIHLVGAGAVLAVSSLWWIIVVDAIPAGSRPFVDNSATNSEWELAFGYNGLQRITGSAPGGGGARRLPTQFPAAIRPRLAGFGRGLGGGTGVTRLFGNQDGTQIAWLLPAALLIVLGGLVALVVLRRAPRTDRRLAALLLWGIWLVGAGLTLSFASGIVHPYYTNILGPGIAALVGIAVPVLWRARHRVAARGAMAALLAVTVAWTWELLGRTPGWFPWLRWTVLVAGLLAAAALVVCDRVRVRSLTVALAAVALVAGVAGPAAYTLDSVGAARHGALVSAGPTTVGFGRGGRRAFAAVAGQSARARRAALGGGAFGAGGFGAGGFGAGGFGAAGFGAAGFGAATGGRADAALVRLLDVGAHGYTWVAATVGSTSAAPLELATGHPVMAIGGFSGRDPVPTLSRFEQLVAAHRIHYFVASGRRGGGAGAGGGASAGATIETWVAANYQPMEVGSTTVYELKPPV